MTKSDAVNPKDGDDIFDDFEALTALVQRSFESAARKAIAENDRLGIPTAYGRDGKVYFRMPPKTKSLD
jgi:hypothetical protein